MNVLNRNPLRPRQGQSRHAAGRVHLRAQARSQSLPARLGRRHPDQDRWPTSSPSTRANADEALRFRPGPLLAAEATRGDLSELEYRSARPMDLPAAKVRGLDAYMARHKLDAVVFPGVSGLRYRRQRGLSQRPGAGGLHRAASTIERRRTFRSASPSPAAPGARRRCCGGGLCLRAVFDDAPPAAGAAGAFTDHSSPSYGRCYRKTHPSEALKAAPSEGASRGTSSYRASAKTGPPAPPRYLAIRWMTAFLQSNAIAPREDGEEEAALWCQR